LISPPRGLGMQVFCALLLLVAASLHGAVPDFSPTRVTVLVQFEKQQSQVSLLDMQRGIQSILDPIGLTVNVRHRSSVKEHEQFGPLVIFTMKGRCDMDPWPMTRSSSQGRALAMAYSSDGIVLPFGEVQCDRVRESIQSAVGRVNSGTYKSMFAKAIGVVMAHELYHMLANSSHHTKAGVTKESLSPLELVDNHLEFPDSAKEAIRSSLH